MNRSAEDISKSLNRIILIIAVIFLFIARGEKVSHCPPCTVRAPSVEFKADAHAIPVVTTEAPAIKIIALNDLQKIDAVFRTSPEVVFNLNITCLLQRSFSSYLDIKPFVLKTFQKQLRPRFPDEDAFRLS